VAGRLGQAENHEICVAQSASICTGGRLRGIGSVAQVEGRHLAAIIAEQSAEHSAHCAITDNESTLEGTGHKKKFSPKMFIVASPRHPEITIASLRRPATM
jgi:hypothetical protein